MQRASMFKFVVLAVCFFSDFGLPDGHGRSAASDTASAVRGRRTFTRVGCSLCHSDEAQGGAGPRLAPRPLPLAAIRAFVRGTTGDMPAYSEKVLSDSDLADIYAFLTSVRPAPAPNAIPALKNLDDKNTN